LNLDLCLAFVVATTVMILLPGPSVMLTVAHSLAFGAIRALATVSGAVLPQLTDPASPWLPQMVLLGVTFVVLGFVFTTGLALAMVRRA
jgi:threonine/homoserine/homoserine lactone efflux protein